MLKALLTTLIAVLCCRNAVSAAALLEKPRPDGRIVGGLPVEIEDIPYQVSLFRHSHFCGGSLIAKDVVLTAAHCTAGQSAANIKVRIGSTLNTEGGIIVNVRKIYRHEQYNPETIDYDFSILKLHSYNDSDIAKGYASLPKANDDIADGTPLTVSGWGLTHNPQEPFDILRATTVPKVNQKDCNEAYARFGGVTERMICAGFVNGGKDACQGDSGGPLVNNNTLVGVVSWGYGCAQPYYPGVYSRVAAVRDWIEDKLKYILTFL